MSKLYGTITKSAAGFRYHCDNILSVQYTNVRATSRNYFSRSIFVFGPISECIVKARKQKTDANSHSCGTEAKAIYVFTLFSFFFVINVLVIAMHVDLARILLPF